MYRFLILAIPLLVSAAGTISPSNIPLEQLALSQKGSIVLSDTSIGGLKIGMSEDRVIKILGVPQSRKTAPNQCTGSRDITLKYPKLELYLTNGSGKKSQSYLTAITTTNPRQIANKGIKVGDLMSKAEQVYSKAAVVGEKGLSLSLSDRKHNECALIFSSDNGKTVSEIDLVCAIC